MDLAMSSMLRHWLQNLSLICLSLACLPFSTALLFFSLSLRPFFKWTRPPLPTAARKTILVTGVSMTKGQTIMSLLAKQTGHRIISADTSILSPGRVSRYCEKFHTLPAPNPSDPSRYVQAMLDVITTEDVDLWISCSGVLSAIEDAQVKQILEKRTKCRAVQFDVERTRTLHEKNLFIPFIKDECKLTIPDTAEVRSRQEVLDTLLPKLKYAAKNPSGDITPRKQYILKPIGVDDAFRADMTLLPYSTATTPAGSTPEEATRRHIERLPISKTRPWLLQEFIKGKEFCTHSIVVNGEVAAFVACPSAELLMHYEALPPPKESKLTAAMLEFTKRVAGVMQERSLEERSGGFTGHLSFDFLVKTEDLEDDATGVILYPIECNPRAHTATVLFNDCPEAAQAYLKVLHEDHHITNGHSDKPRHPNAQTFYPEDPARYYWLPHDIVTLLILPLLKVILQILSPSESSPLPTVQSQLELDLSTFINHLILWKDASYAIDDPLPAWWLYHVYWPGQFAKTLWTGRKWSRINVSTTKMFRLE